MFVRISCDVTNTKVTNTNTKVVKISFCPLDVEILHTARIEIVPFWFCRGSTCVTPREKYCYFTSVEFIQSDYFEALCFVKILHFFKIVF